MPPLIVSVLILLLGFAAASAEPVTPARVGTLPAAERAAWQAYLARSSAAARADQAALDAELAANHMAAALQAPDGGDFKLPAKADDPSYAGEQARRLADVILSYQTPSGGWSKHTDYSQGARKPGMQWTSQNKPGARPHYVATFDNRSTTEQLYFLAYVWHATKREDCKAAFLKGLDFVLAAQFPNGGWPQGYPLEGGYHDDITFNDDAMTRVLRVLQSVGSGEPYFAFVDEARRAKAAAAMTAGVRCMLKLQVEQDRRKTVWCAQYDPITLQPSGARKFEPATLSGAESARVLEFLMSINSPAPEIIAAVESGLEWFEKKKITNIKKTKRGGITTYESDPSSTEVYWARFYDLKTGKPVFPGRDGIMHETYEAMAAGKSVGYDYYTTQPASLLNAGQKKWRKMLAQPPK
jgi:PelA/Pel-15E family pectate lyase